MKITALLKATALAAALCAPQLRAGIVIADNLNQDFAASVELDPTTFWAAQSFFSGSYGALAAVHLNLYSDTEGQYNVELWNASGAGGRPGSMVAVLAGGLSNPITDNEDNVVSITGLNVPITKLRHYYIVVKPLSGSIHWGYTESTSGTGFPSRFSYYDVGGGNWSEPSLSDPQRMMVEAVPEASTWLAGAFAGLALAGGWARRKWQARQARSLN
ncbi:hypothetical protein [Limisphaera sp. VF-2]|jgi:hypothetical protein|uniref:hypothetical protein n=1 Tax=Limisphaera sp. VF-2 TaxID=3400418 RepID=UPI00175EF87B